jgi:WhiB family redox-sensing transcriptional regulator
MSTDWMRLGACNYTDPEIFFAEKGPGHLARAAEAKRICRQVCTVATQCLTYALERDERYGIWAGTDPDERAAVRRRKGRRETAA